MLVSTAVRLGFRRGNIITLGTSPTASALAEGVEILNSFWRTVQGSELGENLTDWSVPPPAGRQQSPRWLAQLVDSPDASTWWLYPVQNVRLLTKATASTTVYLPAEPDDGARISIVDIGSSAVSFTLDGNGRKIEGQLTLVESSPTVLNGVTWMYRADLASWERVSDITSAGLLPLPAEFDDLWINYLAIQVAPSNSEEAPEEIVATFKAALARLKARYRQSRGIAVNSPSASHSRFGPGSASSWFA